MNVSAVIVTRGNVDLNPIIQSLRGWEVVVWDNGARRVTKYNNGSSIQRWHARVMSDAILDLSVYGRYAAIDHASGDLIYVQDDDCIVSEPHVLLDEWYAQCTPELVGHGVTMVDEYEGIVANMPRDFRHDFYTDHCLVGFGAVFHRDAPERAFQKIFPDMLNPDPAGEGWWDYSINGIKIPTPEFFRRACDIVFTGLTPSVWVDVPYENMPYAYADDRMWRQPTHQSERSRMRELVRQVREGSPA